MGSKSEWEMQRTRKRTSAWVRQLGCVRQRPLLPKESHQWVRGAEKGGTWRAERDSRTPKPLTSDPWGPRTTSSWPGCPCPAGVRGRP